MDATFGADCQNAEGRLENVYRGRFGMDIVTKYLLIAVDQPGAQAFHAPMMLKLERLRDELEIVVCHEWPSRGPNPRCAPITSAGAEDSHIRRSPGRGRDTVKGSCTGM